MSTRAKPHRPYALVRPCAKCPFRSDVEPYLRPERAHEIAQTVQGGSEFYCHETTVEIDDEDGGTMGRGPDTKVCAGSLILAEKSGGVTQVMRISERLGMYDPSRLDMSAPVSENWQEWVARFREGDEPDLPHCGVAGDDCEDPLGWGGAGIVLNTEPGICEVECSMCGHDMCPACRAEDNEWGDPVCVHCAEDYED